MDSSQMLDVGFLVLSRHALPRLADRLAAAASRIRSKLYVRIDPQQTPEELRRLVPGIYLEASQCCANLDVRVLLRPRAGVTHGEPLSELCDPEDPSGSPGPKPFRHVVLGGTFDRLHNGHKVLLSTAALMADRITCGVTNGEMNKRKILHELMEPIERRIAGVQEFLNDVSDGLEIDVQEITDAYGPSIVKRDLDVIVVSEETLKGGNAVNAKRKELGMTELAVHKIDLVEGSDAVLNEAKLSSSTRRRSLLGTLLRPPNKDVSGLPPHAPCVVGLTGGIASGKSHIARFLAQHGCDVADCDRIVHQLYAGHPRFAQAIAEAFGADLVQEGVVDRRRLGALVFNDREKRDRLQGIMWPAVREEVHRRLTACTADVFVIDAALLLEAGWQNDVHQLWTTFVPRAEAVRRVVERDGLSEVDAEARIDSQVSNETRIAASHVVFCSLWAHAETERQVKMALDRIRSAHTAAQA